MEDTQAHEERVRERAYRLWLEEGMPEGRADVHWEQARELVAIEESQRDTLLPNPLQDWENSPTTEPVEPIEAVENAGEFPGLTDQGKGETAPSFERAEEADEPPLGSAGQQGG